MIKNITADELFKLTPWRVSRMDLSIYADLEWTCAHSGKVCILCNGEVALEGGGMRLLVCPHKSDHFSIIKIKGFFKYNLITEYAAPTRSEINAIFDQMRDLGVIESKIHI